MVEECDVLELSGVAINFNDLVDGALFKTPIPMTKKT